MSKITFEVTIEARDAECDSDAEEVENICGIILDGLGFPDRVKVTA